MKSFQQIGISGWLKSYCIFRSHGGTLNNVEFEVSAIFHFLDILILQQTHIAVIFLKTLFSVLETSKLVYFKIQLKIKLNILSSFDGKEKVKNCNVPNVLFLEKLHYFYLFIYFQLTAVEKQQTYYLIFENILL